MAEVTVICAVWHKDPNRAALIRGHAANLRRQTVAIDSVYVFDGGDVAPGDLEAETISAKTPLSIYQAWNLALAAARTPFVMNLNLDDRLAPDAIEKLLTAIKDSQSMLVGGDWRICYTQAETDDVDNRCVPARDLPFSPTWPPSPGIKTRLGSGTGERGTYGPATLWRMSAHAKIPRYPWRFTDGSLLNVIGDSVFWSILQHLDAPLTRLPIVIGNYHSHPSDQAEFRWPDERARTAYLGIEML